MSGFGSDCLYIEVFSVINCHVASATLLDLAASGGYVVLHRYYGREVFYQVASGKCQGVEGSGQSGLTRRGRTPALIPDFSWR